MLANGIELPVGVFESRAREILEVRFPELAREALVAFPGAARPEEGARLASRGFLARIGTGPA